MDPEVTLTVVDDPDPAEVGRIVVGLGEHAAAEGLPAHRSEPVVVLLRRDGEVVGGVDGATNWGWLHVAHLWVAEPLRRGGHGRRLLAAAEDVARRRGCVAVWLDTYSFQAPDFYPRLGYRSFGRLEGYPPGHARLFFWKPLW